MSRQSLNILMVLRTPVGGLYRHVIDLSNELGRRGHKIGLIYDSTTGDAQTAQRISAMEHPPVLGIHQVSMPRLLGLSDLFAALKIRSLAKFLKADILHGHGAKGGFNGRIAAMISSGKAAIYTPHGGVLHFSKSKLTGKVLYGIERFLINKTTAIIFESSFAKLTFERQIGDTGSLSTIIHNGLLPEEFAPLDPEKPEFDFAFVGEIRQLKGIHILLEALASVKRKDGSGANLIIAGDGPDVKNLKQQIANLELTDRVEMVGVKPAREVFEMARAVIVPSLAESLPYVVLEAAAAQKPVLASDVGGIGEIYGPTKKALLPPGDVLALQTALQNNVDYPDAAAAEMNTRLKWIKENFSLTKMADGIEAIYKRATSGKSQGQPPN